MGGSMSRKWVVEEGRLRHLAVFAHVNGGVTPVGTVDLVGRIDARRQAQFRYDEALLADRSQPPLFPVRLPKRRKSVNSEAGLDMPLPFYDAAPDGWGKALLTMAYPDTHFGTPEFIAAAGNDRIGNLMFGPDDVGPDIWRPDEAMIDLPTQDDDIEALMDAAAAVEEGVATRSHLAKLLDSGADIGGARPKARIIADGAHWIVKMRATGDGFDHEAVEAACLSAAVAAGIETPDHSTMSIHGRTALLVKRFDRAEGLRYPFMSAATLVGQRPSDYGTKFTYVDVALQAKRAGIAPCADALFCRMLFNCYMNNTDDHLHNHGFLNDGRGWRLSPLYDVVPQAKRGLTLRPAPRASAEADPQKAFVHHSAFGLSAEEAEGIHEQVRAGVSTFRYWLDAFCVSEKDRQTLERMMPYAFSVPRADATYDVEVKPEVDEGGFTPSP